MSTFKKTCTSQPHKSEGVIAIEKLTELIKGSNVNTVQGLSDLLAKSSNEMQADDCSNSSVKSACELFQRFITLAVLDAGGDFDSIRKILLSRAQIFLEKVAQCRDQIAKNALGFISDHTVILLHHNSRVVFEAIRYAFVEGGRRNIFCYLVQTSNKKGFSIAQKLSEIGVKLKIIPIEAVSYIMPKIDRVFLGAEAVVESGGILNSMGSCTVALVAKTMAKPVYVLTESFKFVRSFPLDQQHIPNEFKKASQIDRPFSKPELTEEDDSGFEELNSPWEKLKKLRTLKVEEELPPIDYTPPNYIKLLITDLGILTTSAVSDELIKLYL